MFKHLRTHTLNHKLNDCFVCAYASCEGISWNLARKRLRRRKMPYNRDTGVSTIPWKYYTKHGYPIPGYKHSEKGSASIRNHMNGGRGIVCFSKRGSSGGHAVYWNGYKFLCNEKGSVHNMCEEEFSDLVKHHDLIVKHLAYKVDVPWYEKLCTLPLYNFKNDVYRVKRAVRNVKDKFDKAVIDFCVRAILLIRSSKPLPKDVTPNFIKPIEINLTSPRTLQNDSQILG